MWQVKSHEVTKYSKTKFGYESLPGESDVVREEGGPVGMDDLDGQPQHEEHRAAEDHHGGQEATGVSHDGEVDHLVTCEQILLLPHLV